MGGGPNIWFGVPMGVWGGVPLFGGVSGGLTLSSVISSYSISPSVPFTWGGGEKGEGGAEEIGEGAGGGGSLT